jgi:hypothetical protein
MNPGSMSWNRPIVPRTWRSSAHRWHEARAARSTDLRSVEGDATFEGQQRFLETAARLAAERRLSRIAFRAIRR